MERQKTDLKKEILKQVLPQAVFLSEESPPQHKFLPVIFPLSHILSTLIHRVDSHNHHQSSFSLTLTATHIVVTSSFPVSLFLSLVTEAVTISASQAVSLLGHHPHHRHHEQNPLHVSSDLLHSSPMVLQHSFHRSFPCLPRQYHCL